MKKESLAKDCRWKFVKDSHTIITRLQTVSTALSVITAQAKYGNPHDITDSMDSILEEATAVSLIVISTQEKIAELANAIEREIQSEYK